MSNSTKTKAEKILKEVFGFEKFRPLQLEIIEKVLKKKDTIVIMPTGGGKSICYQIPALMFNGLTIVISPLLSLIKDQIEQLKDFGVEATALSSALSYKQYSRNISRIMKGEVKLVYMAPETLLKQKILSMLSSLPIECLTIDEAHCISEWGHDFRPEYRQIIEARKTFKDSVCIALTATATSRVREDIKNCMNLKTSKEFIASFNRKNLFLRVIQKSNPYQQTVRFIKKFRKKSGIIYCLSRRQVDALAYALKKDKISARPYHAGMSDKSRIENQELFIQDKIQIIVATIAFGMGINKPDIRFILHFDLTPNIESYYQQIGRAGRDGLRADCLLLFSPSDIRTIKYFINHKSDAKERFVANNLLSSMLQFVKTDKCRRVSILRYFGEESSKSNCKMCDNCV